MVAALSPMSFRWGWVLLPILLLAGCRDGTKHDVIPGEYRARLEGSLMDTLAGPAVYRLQDDGIVGIELGAQDSSGLSIQLGPEPVHPRTYAVTDASLLEGRAADRLTGVIAFLSLRSMQLRATRGSLSVSHVGDGEVRGTFDFDMRGRAPGSPGELTVRVRGELRATAEATAE